MAGLAPLSDLPISTLPHEAGGTALVPVQHFPTFSSLSSGDFAQAALQHFPRGRAWSRRPDSTLAAICAGIGDCIAAVHEQFVLFLDRESDPAQAQQLLADWEADFGLPDSCAPSGQTVAERQAALLSKIAASPGGQSASYFVSVAAALGYAITITTWDAFTFGKTPFGSPLVQMSWRFAWRVNAPAVVVSRFTFGRSPFGEPFWSLSATALACRLRKLAPAYGVLQFSYSD